MAETDESSGAVPAASSGWLQPIATKRFAVVGDVIYAITATIAVLLGFFCVGFIWSETIGVLSLVTAPLVWVLGAAVKYTLGGGPFGSSW